MTYSSFTLFPEHAFFHEILFYYFPSVSSNLQRYDIKAASAFLLHCNWPLIFGQMVFYCLRKSSDISGHFKILFFYSTSNLYIIHALILLPGIGTEHALILLPGLGTDRDHK